MNSLSLKNTEELYNGFIHVPVTLKKWTYLIDSDAKSCDITSKVPGNSL